VIHPCDLADRIKKADRDTRTEDGAYLHCIFGYQ
jgi:hypothetical protein